jgi:hypothetical protein
MSSSSSMVSPIASNCSLNSEILEKYDPDYFRHEMRAEI